MQPTRRKPAGLCPNTDNFARVPWWVRCLCPSAATYCCTPLQGEAENSHSIASACSTQPLLREFNATHRTGLVLVESLPQRPAVWTLEHCTLAHVGIETRRPWGVWKSVSTRRRRLASLRIDIDIDIDTKRPRRFRRSADLFYSKKNRTKNLVGDEILPKDSLHH